jgi:hypothetical protein
MQADLSIEATDSAPADILGAAGNSVAASRRDDAVDAIVGYLASNCVRPYLSVRGAMPGRWKQELTAELNEVFVRELAEEMQHFGYAP